MVSNYLVMPVLLRLGLLRSAGGARPDRAAPRHPARRDRGGAAARLSSTSALAGEAYALVVDRPRLVRGRGAVRARRCWAACTGRAAPARGALAGLTCRLRGLGLHPAPAVVRPVRLAAASLPRPGAVRHRRCCKPRRCSACGGLDEIAMRCSGACCSTSAAYVGVSLLGRPERRPSTARRALFVDVFHARAGAVARFWRGTRLGRRAAPRCSRASSGRSARARRSTRLRAGAWLGPGSCDAPTPTCVTAPRPSSWPARSARPRRGSMVASVVQEEPLGLEEVMRHPRRDLADHRLQPPAGAEVARARGGDGASCARPTSACKELDRLKDDFVSTVTHELRTPLTSIRAFSEILHDNPGA